MSKFETTSYCIPSHFLPYLINGDCSGLEDSEIDEIDNFLKTENLSNGHWSYDSDNESYFSHWNDVNNLGSDVVDIDWVSVA